MGPLVRALLRAGHVLPAARGEEAVVPAGHQLGAVLEHDAVGQLDRPPMLKDLGRHEAPVDAPALRAVYAVPGGPLLEPPGGSVGLENGCATQLAVGAGMRATPVGV